MTKAFGLVVTVCLLPVAHGFSVSAAGKPLMKGVATGSSSLFMAASSMGPTPSSSSGVNDSWSNKPLHRPRSTKPVDAPNKASWIQRQTMENAMIDPDYSLTIAMALLCPLIIWYHPSYAEDGAASVIGVCGGLFHLLFAALLWVQTRRVRCVFERDAFEFYNIKGPHLDLERGARLERKPANYVSGTRNRWSYKDIINYGFFPSLEFPFICYFKETETPERQWDRWFAAFDSYGRGQPHFFPGIVNVRQFKEQLEARGVKSKPIPSFKSKE